MSAEDIFRTMFGASAKVTPEYKEPARARVPSCGTVGCNAFSDISVPLEQGIVLNVCKTHAVSLIARGLEHNTITCRPPPASWSS